jgi:hypothetical protein
VILARRRAGAALVAVTLWASGCVSKATTGLCAVDPDEPKTVLRGVVIVRGPERMLRWQSFPRPQDESALGPGGAALVRNVRYELEIWALPGPTGIMAPPTVVTGLTAPEYRLKDLAQGEQYWWAVRARFELEGRPRVTQWTTEGAVPRLWDGPAGHPLLRVEDVGAAK